MENLKNLKVAVLVAEGFELSEFVEPVKALKEQGATVHVISPQKDTVRSWDNGNWGKEFKVDTALENANSNDFDALLLPGGVINPDKLRRYEKAIDFVKAFMKEAKPVAAICHGPWTLIETGMVKGRTLTSFHSIKTDLINAGANWEDKEVVVDNNLVTSRNPGDIPVFVSKMTEKFREGVHV
ncbi:MAG: type 1 glutamine amidotransferase [Bacteroidota bacterium]|nr:type 1 glutamine amidotransferase [Bacteroidota bacterium]